MHLNGNSIPSALTSAAPAVAAGPFSSAAGLPRIPDISGSTWERIRRQMP